MAYITLKAWAEREGIDPSTARQKARRGSLRTVIKVGRDWLIDDAETNPDLRFKANKRAED